MKVGEYATTQEIANQGEHRWVLLSDLVFSKPGGVGVKGGTIRAIAHTKKEAAEKEDVLCLDAEDTLLVSGSWEELVLGGVFVE